jgi:hypothetical protein
MPDDTALIEASDPAILRAEWRLRMIEELAEIGMDLARDLHRQALAAADPAEPAAADTAETPTTSSARRAAIPGDEPAAAFARLSRAVRLSLALHARTDEALRALRAGVVAEREARRVEARNRAADDAEARRRSHGEKIERLVIEAAEREIEDEEALGGVLEALDERLDQDEAYQDLDRLPLRETVERLCADLQLTPDWSRWEGEGWTPEEPFYRPRASIWVRPSRGPLGLYDSGEGGVQPGSPRAHCRE